jgi:hypothetical protein
VKILIIEYEDLLIENRGKKAQPHVIITLRCEYQGAKFVKIAHFAALTAFAHGKFMMEAKT